MRRKSCAKRSDWKSDFFSAVDEVTKNVRLVVTSFGVRCGRAIRPQRLKPHPCHASNGMAKAMPLPVSPSSAVLRLAGHARRFLCGLCRRARAAPTHFARDGALFFRRELEDVAHEQLGVVLVVALEDDRAVEDPVAVFLAEEVRG